MIYDDNKDIYTIVRNINTTIKNDCQHRSSRALCHIIINLTTHENASLVKQDTFIKPQIFKLMFCTMDTTN